MTTVPGQVRSSSAGLYADGDGYDDPQIERTRVHHTTETRRSFVTTEFWVMLVAAAAIMISAYTDNAFDIDQGWTLVTAIVVGYMVSRGFAKAGSRESYTRES
ncbi:MAG TPA: hypothetical protein VFS16_02045 [Acidimicrobiia bacterium]|nr:hypothetical protein [Acidimicrobiia bacterium]